MAAEVSSLVRIMNGSRGRGRGDSGGGGDMNEAISISSSSSGSGGKWAAPATRDLLGGCCSLDSKELDLDLQVPSGWEKRLDLKSGKVYLQRCNSSNSTTSTLEQKQHNLQTVGRINQDLNLFPPGSKQLPLMSLFDETNLNLTSSLKPSSSSSTTYHSACTLEKVKSALERAEKETTRKRCSMSISSSSPTSVSSSDIFDQYQNLSASFATGCPSCLLYVLISKNNPICPRCSTIVPLPVAMNSKKPRIDLNISI